MVKDPDAIRQAGIALAQRVGAGYRLLDWQHASSSYFSAIQVERNVMFLILTLIIVVLAFVFLRLQTRNEAGR